MTADLTASAERALRTPEEIRDVPADQRTPDELYQYGTDGPWPGRPLPVVHVDPPEAAKPTKPWVVVRQSHLGGEVVDTVESYHRWEWTAEMAARRRTNRDAGRHGAYFNARRADS